VIEYGDQHIVGCVEYTTGAGEQGSPGSAIPIIEVELVLVVCDLSPVPLVIAEGNLIRLAEGSYGSAVGGPGFQGKTVPGKEEVA
jgi:hypothetical protein